MSNLKHLASVTALLALITGAGTTEARDRPGTPTDPRVILASPTEVDIYFRNTAGGVLVVFPLEIKLDGKRLHPDLERTVSQNIFKGGMYGNGEVTRRITSEDVGGRLGPGIEFCFRAWSRTRVRNETYFTASDDVFSEIPSAWACGVPLPNKPPQPTQVISEYRACLDAGSQCRPDFKDRAVLVRWLIPTFPFGTTIDHVAVEKKRYLPDVTDWEVDFSKEYVIRNAMKQPQYDGEFLSPPKQDGKYMYRVCLENAAGRECGVANLSLVVETPRIQGTARTPGVAVAEAAAPRTTTPVEELKNPNTARAQAAATAVVAVAEASESRGSSSRVDPSAPVTLNPQPRTAAIVPAAPIGGARGAAEPITPKPTPSRTPTMTTDGAAGTQVVAAADVPTLYKPRGQQARQPARDQQQEQESQQQALAHRATGDLPGAAKILCRGGKSMRLEPMSEEIARMLDRRQNGATYTLYFGTTEATVGADGNGLHASTCAYLGQPWKAGDPPGIRFDTKPDGAFFYNKAPPADAEETESRPHYLDRPDHYWLFFVKPAHGFFEAVGHEVWKSAVGPQVAATAEAIEAKPGVPKGATAASQGTAAAAQIPSSLFDMNDRAIIVVGGKKMTAPEVKPPPPPPVQSPQPRLSMSTSHVRGGADQVIQGTALPGAAAANQTAAKIEELVCRGGSALGFEKRGEKVTPSGNAALIAMHFGIAPVAADKSGRGLSHSTCAFVGRTWVQGDPPGVQFETRSRSSKERDIKRAQHGSSAPAVGPDDAERMADELSIPVYLANPSHYWRFSVTKGWGYFLAGDHGFVKTTLATVGSRSDVISKTSIARLHNVQVRPSIGGARFRFVARPEADPTIDLGKQPPVTGRDGLKVLANPITMRAERDVMGGSNAAVNWYAAGTDAQRIRLEQNAEYHYLITVPGNGAVPIQQHSGKLTTLQKVLKVTFKSVHILDDSDDLSDGEGAFTYCVNDADQVQEVSNFATGTDVPVNREFVFDRWEDGPLKIEVEGIDDDSEGRLLRGGCSLKAPGRNTSADQNVARVQIDTTSPHLAGRRGATGFRIESLPRPRSDWLAFNVLVEVEILRPSD